MGLGRGEVSGRVEGWEGICIPMKRTIQRHHVLKPLIDRLRYKYSRLSSHPRSVSVNLCVSPSMSNILIVLSDEQVASLLP